MARSGLKEGEAFFAVAFLVYVGRQRWGAFVSLYSPVLPAGRDGATQTGANAP